MIGKSLNERFGPQVLPIAPDRAVALLLEAMATQAENVVKTRAQGPDSIACLIYKADSLAIQVCKSFGMEMTRGGSGVFGLTGADAARHVPGLTQDQRTWLSTASSAQETKVLLFSSGVATLTLKTVEGKTTVQVA